MAIKYYKLLDLLNKRNISKGELQKMANISSATMAKLSSNENVSLEVIDKICICLKVQPNDIFEVIDETVNIYKNNE
jgi:DNA-binding Xre family transcriptional regulator